MNSLEIFKNEEFGEIRTVQLNNEPMFCLSDVCRVLEVKNATDVAKRLDEDEVTRFNLGGQAGEANFVTESGLYAVILRSDKPNAKKFRKWVTSEVIPSIRMTGSYQKPKTAIEQLQLTQQAVLEVSEKIANVNDDLQEFKETLPLLAVDCDRITSAVKARGTHFLGGHDSNAYSDKSLRQRVYSDIHREVKRQFGVSTYKAIRRNQCDRAVQFVNQYEIPFVLQDEIEDVNAQERMFG